MSDLSKALVAAAVELSDPPAVAKNAHFGQPYADLKAVVKSIREPLARHGISVTQSPEVLVEADRRSVRLVTVIRHASGETAEYATTWPMPPNANIQQFGAAITYLRRYTLCSLLNLVGDPDDDAEVIVAPTRKEPHDTARRNPVR
jgi:hypothetical protein